MNVIHHHQYPKNDRNGGDAVQLPRLYLNLKLALTTLYSLPIDNLDYATVTTNSLVRPSSEQSHEYLMNLQSRNVRRRILSIQQRYRDQQQNQQKLSTHSTTITERSHDNDDHDLDDVHDNQDSEFIIPLGSSWLACFASLCLPTVSFTERLFAAQTILHRLRRTKLIEAIDWEMEVPYDIRDPQICCTFFHRNDDDKILFYSNMIRSYKQWIQSINPMVGAFVESYTIPDHELQQTASNEEIEERIKGELTILTLAVFAYYFQVSESFNNNDSATTSSQSTIGPLLATCMSALVTTAVRLRYPPTILRGIGFGDTVGPSTVNTLPLVKTVQTIFDKIWQRQLEQSTTTPYHHQALISILHICLGCIPDTIMGSPGGARGRFSIDPRCLQAAISELRMVDVVLLSEIMTHQIQSQVSDVQNRVPPVTNSTFLDREIVQTCTKWTTYVQLTPLLLEMTISRVDKFLASSNDIEQKHAFQFLIALYESGSWSVDQILSASVGCTSQQQNASQQSTRKKQSNKSKKRQKEIVDQNTSDIHVAQAHDEMKLRGECSCRATIAIWDTLRVMIVKALHLHGTNESVQVDGEGPIGCLASCANACLPYILRNPSFPYSRELFTNITQCFQEICACTNKAVRVMSYEPLYSLHTTLVCVCRNQQHELGNELQAIIVDHFFKCSMSLASACVYPENYFDELSLPSDEDLEVERNDIRDLLRTITDAGESGSDMPVIQKPLPVCLHIISRILSACQDAITNATENSRLVSEAVAHAFSSLAKPLNNAAEYFSGDRDSTDMGLDHILSQTLSILLGLSTVVIEGFRQAVPYKQLLPLSRVVNIAIASLSPMFSYIISSRGNTKTEVTTGVVLVLNSAIHSSILSLENIPELYAPSILEHSMYDIRGAMRGPGGEDHVGCLVLKRLAFESTTLARQTAEACAPFMERLCTLLHDLKIIEFEKGQFGYHGSRGVTPQSRRILVNALCQLEHVSDGSLGASSLLTNLFNTTVETIASARNHNVDESTLFRITECTFDLASFSPTIIASLFDLDGNNQQRILCLETLTHACVTGYHAFDSNNHDMGGTALQWNRLRGALFLLLKLSANPDFPKSACEIMIACITAECNAIKKQCSLGPASESAIFCEGLICDEVIPAGLYVKLLDDAVIASGSLEGHPVLLLNCLQTLHHCATNVTDCIILQCPDPSENSFVDPRPTVAESWFLVLTSLIDTGMVNETVQLILINTCVSFVSLLFNTSMAKTIDERRRDPGMSLDGSQSRTALAFLVRFFGLGFNPLLAAGQKLTTIIPLNDGDLQQWCTDHRMYGIAIIGASLFRANQGSLPPWAVESIPEVYSSLFIALNKNVNAFCDVIRLSMEVKVSSNATASFGMVQPGNLLSGKLFGSMSEKAKCCFIADVMKLCHNDDPASWRRMKAIIKQACGGKKKETDFGQKPTLTKWEFFRI